jgi:predicted Zn-dependent protease
MSNNTHPPELARALVLGQARLRDDVVEAIAHEGQQLFAAGRRADAEKIFEGLAFAAPTSYLGWAGRGAVALADDDVHAAEEWLARAVALQPADAAVYANYAETLQRLGKADAAQAALKRALELDPAAAHPCTARVMEFMPFETY